MNSRQVDVKTHLGRTRLGYPPRMTRPTVAIPALVIVLATVVGAASQPARVGPAALVRRVATAPWDAASLGHHRVVVLVGAPGEVARIDIPWRRRDADPANRHLIVTDAAGQRIANVVRVLVNRERAELLFEPAAGPGVYYVYFMPWESAGRSNYPRVTYPAPIDTADPAWRTRAIANRAAPTASVDAIEAIDAVHEFTDMEVIATAAEVEAFVAPHRARGWLVVPEDRDHPVRMTRDLPLRWIARGDTPAFAGIVRRGEFFAFQLAVYAWRDAAGVSVRFSDLAPGGGRTIPASAFSCINLGGVDWTGRPFTKTVDVEANRVQPLWCGIDVPADAAPGVYHATATITAASGGESAVAMTLTVSPTVVPRGGADEPWRQTRLKWLDSRLAQENTVIPPYTPIVVAARRLGLLGRDLDLDDTGLPTQIRTYFTEEMTSIGSTPTDVLAAPIRLVAERPDGTRLEFTGGAPTFTEQSPGTARWTSVSRADDLRLEASGTLEFDGFLAYQLAITSATDIDLADIRLELPYRAAASTYLMGLGQRGGARPSRLDWTWSVATRNQDGAWLGGINAGLYFSLRDEHYVRPLNTNFYLQKPLGLPTSWGNDGRGGITIAERGEDVHVTAFSGRRSLKAGTTLRFDVNFIVTPFHPLDTAAQWQTRFYHRFSPVADVKATGATVVNVHHANAINPWINYPFIAHREMKAYIDAAHAQGLKVKIYNTVRELSNRAYELFPLRSLGHEIFSPGAGGGFSWLQEHLGDDYIAAWFVPDLQDAAIINSGMSRWHNYYVEGMSWLVQQVGIDGIYLDDVAFDRTTMKRVKRVLTQDGHPGIVDLHSANQFNQRDGYISSALLYLEHFPYVNRLWFGEYFDYERSSADFFLTEVSGIPFGLMGEMLEGGGNPWRGMVYGMTNRMPWTENSDPRPLWTAWDAFGMADTRMIGYWVMRNPVKTSRADVLATTFVKPAAATPSGARALVALASWAETDVEVQLAFDWAALGIDPARAVVSAQSIDGFQPARVFAPGDTIPVARGRGWLLTLGQRP